MRDTIEETLTVKEIRDILQIGSNTVYCLIHSGEFPVVKIGRTYRIPRESFVAWLNRSNIAPQ